MGEEKKILLRGKVCAYLTCRLYGNPISNYYSCLLERRSLFFGWVSIKHCSNARRFSMGTFKIEGVTHWSIPVNNLKESEDFYGGLLGLKAVGRLNNNVMSCFNIGDHNILLCEREKPQDKNTVEERVHHSFTVSPEGFVQACKTLHEKKIPIVELEYRAKGYFTGREPSRDPRPHLEEGNAGAALRGDREVLSKTRAPKKLPPKRVKYTERVK